jgi:hypothetical protein
MVPELPDPGLPVRSGYMYGRNHVAEGFGPAWSGGFPGISMYSQRRKIHSHLYPSNFIGLLYFSKNVKKKIQKFVKFPKKRGVPGPGGGLGTPFGGKTFLHVWRRKRSFHGLSATPHGQAIRKMAITS